MRQQIRTNGVDGANTQRTVELIRRLEDGDGEVISFDGGPIRIAGGDNPDAVKMFKKMQLFVVDPVIEFVAGLAENVIATSGTKSSNFTGIFSTRNELQKKGGERGR